MGTHVGSLEASSGLSTEDPETESIDRIVLFATLLCSCIVIGHLLEKTRWINQSVTALLIGLGTGCIILLTSGGKSSRILEFQEEFFFIYLLPPIIFNAGFQVKKKQFFRNFMTITSFGAIGTLISFAIISYGATLLFPKLDIGYLEMKDYLALGAIFSATDSVCALQVLNQEETPLLYSLVFGEGVVNDATSVVLFNAITNFDLSNMNATAALTFAYHFLTLFVLSTLLGVFVGLLCAFIIRTLYFGSHSTDREIALMILMAYLSYITAEVFKLSGILTVFFCGIVMSHYAWHNVTLKSQVTTKHIFATMSYIAEVFIFLYVGMDSLDVEKWRFIEDSPGKSFTASGILVVLIMVGRAAFVFPLSLLSNFMRKDGGGTQNIKIKQQVTVWWAGLMRGAVSVALAYKKFTGSGQTIQPANALLITSTITVVLFSTVVFGLLTKPIIRWLLPDETDPSTPNSSSNSMPLLQNGHGHGHGPGPENENNGRLATGPSLKMLLDSPTNMIHQYWRKFDDACMRPVFGGRGFVSYATGTRDMGVIH